MRALSSVGSASLSLSIFVFQFVSEEFTWSPKNLVIRFKLSHTEHSLILVHLSIYLHAVRTVAGYKRSTFSQYHECMSVRSRSRSTPNILRVREL